MYAWFIASLKYDIVCQREQWQKNVYETESALGFGLQLVKVQFNEVEKRLQEIKEPIECDLSSILASTGLLVIIIIDKPKNIAKPDALMIRALAYRNKNLVCQIRCVLRAIAPKKTTQEKQFVIEYYTVGSTL